MLRITKQSDYAIVLMTHIVSTDDRWLNASELATQAGLPQPIVSKILKLLTRGRLLESHRGVKGGYCLARSSAEITVAEIIEALDVAAPSDHEFGFREFDEPPTDVVVTALDGAAHLRQRDVVGRERVGVDLDLILAHEAADAGDL